MIATGVLQKAYAETTNPPEAELQGGVVEVHEQL